ncbi:MAG TPA: phosphoribosylformylglycinamidine synthase I [Planctomycetes bacterium]|nr:phosphoribosylformylglycinamidine synthase I [Planctomycetota bacterium]
MKPRVLVLRAAGSNCDVETARAFELAGASADLVHVNRLFAGEKRLADYAALAIPGGFTYGDDVAAGKVLAVEIAARLADDVRGFLDNAGLVIGICNGFQALVKTGLLPGSAGLPATLTHNDSQRFEARWVHLKIEPGRCLWTKSIEGEIITLPVAHGEGKFMVADSAALEKLERSGQVAARYVRPDGGVPEYPADPNGSMSHIAGICDPSGRVFGLMPHPERFVERLQHPRFTRGEGLRPWGLEIIRSGTLVAAGRG